jgi:hypothetical protein
MTAKLQDMTLVINVAVTGSVDTKNIMTIDTVCCTLAASVPAAPPYALIVDSEGDIDLAHMAGGPGFTGATDIYFVLGGAIRGPDGKTFPLFFDSPGQKAVTIVIADAGSEGIVPGFTPILPGTGDTSVLLIDDLDQTPDLYEYTLHVHSYVIPGEPAARGSIDPAIVNRGGGLIGLSLRGRRR